ncbi:uncharacterized protein LOC112694550 [Sipha flava]|uniref:Uncharacterized protein LOC112694550 n=2 Tax=Sipha flava TaxID=143950 RepID=A0A8B8GU58_9HEMI|nr:uncharacterized protein LOC112694550 [Sipha flava]
MKENCKHDFERNVLNAKTTGRNMWCRQCFFCRTKRSFAEKMTQCKNCRVLVHDRCLAPKVIGSAVSGLHGILKSTTGDRESGPKGSPRVWHLDDLDVHGYGYHLHRDLEDFLVPCRAPLELDDTVEPVVAEFFRMFAGRKDSSGKTTAVSTEEPNSADVRNGNGGRSRRRRRRRNGRRDANAITKN